MEKKILNALDLKYEKRLQHIFFPKDSIHLHGE